MFQNISMITLGIKDLKKSTDFYINGLGLPQMDFDGDITFIKLQGVMLALKGYCAHRSVLSFQPSYIPWNRASPLPITCTSHDLI